MSLLSVIDRVSSHQPKPFIAPLPDSGLVEVFVLQDDIPYRFKVRDVESGWWLMKPTNGNVLVDRQAYPHEYLNYLSYLPRFYAITCYRLAESTWLVVPYNASDANQRGWLRGVPRPVHLVRESVRPLDVIDTRNLAGVLLFNNTASGPRLRQVDNADWDRAVSLVEARREQLRRQSEEARRQTQLDQLARQRQSVEDEVEFQLQFVGAELISWSERGNGLEVCWKFNGHQHSATLNREMKLESAGICLGDYREDYDWQNLATTVLAINEGRRLRRFDMDRDAWL